jgi:hypothetical protein
MTSIESGPDSTPPAKMSKKKKTERVKTKKKTLDDPVKQEKTRKKSKKAESAVEMETAVAPPKPTVSVTPPKTSPKEPSPSHFRPSDHVWLNGECIDHVLSQDQNSGTRPWWPSKV